MKFTVTLVVLLAAAQAAEVRQTSKSRQKAEDTKTDKRELAEGNAAVSKRAPVLPTALPSLTPGIEYADTKESQSEKSPSQQVYARPLPQISKISDLLTAQGPPFQAAIASHLLAPVSVYQPRLAAPTTYEVSSPIASQLAYSEHKITYQPQQNAIQYTPVQYNQKLQAKQANFVRPINFQPPFQQQIFAQPQPVVYSQQPQLVPIPQPVQYQQIPLQVQRPLQYTQQNVFPQHFVARPVFQQQPQTLVQVSPSVQPGITYAREESNEEDHEQATQSQLKSVEQAEQLPKATENQTPAPEKNSQSQGAVSYASFSQSQPAPFSPPTSTQYQPQTQYQAQTQQPQPQLQQYQAQPQQNQAQPQQYQIQPQQYQTQPQQFQPQTQQYQPQPQNYQLQPQPFQVQPLFHNQPQQQPSQYEIQIQYQAPQNSAPKEIIATASTKTLPVNPQRPVSYFRPGPVLQQVQPQYQPQNYHQQPALLHNLGPAPHSLQSAPAFPPVQYFGKFAQSIFGGVQH